MAEIFVSDFKLFSSLLLCECFAAVVLCVSVASVCLVGGRPVPVSEAWSVGPAPPIGSSGGGSPGCGTRQPLLCLQDEQRCGSFP